MSAADFDRKVMLVEEDLRLVYTPTMGQKKVLYALLFKLLALVFVQCGRKFGKTSIGIYCLWWFAMVFDGCEVYYLADTQTHARELVWANQRLQGFLKKVKRKRGESGEDYEKRKRQAQATHDKWVDKINNSEMRIVLTNGSFIKADGTDNFANADGLEPQFVVEDEFKHHDKRFREAMEPNLDVYNGSELIIGTPPDNGDNYYCEVANDAKRRDDAAFFTMESFTNEHVYPGGEKGSKFQKVVKKYIDRGDWDVLRREYYAQIVAGGSKSIFPMFEPLEIDEHNRIVAYSKHVRPHAELVDNIKRYPKDWEFCVAMDPGTVTCFAVLFGARHRKTNSVVFLDEIYEKDQRKTSTRSIFPRVLKKMDEYNAYHDDWLMVYDNAAAWFANEVAVEFGYGLTPCMKDLKDKEAKLGQIKDVMNAGLWFSSERCRSLSFEKVNYIKDKNGKIPKENDHLIDCERYWFNGLHYDFTLLPDPEPIDPEERERYTIENDPYLHGADEEWDQMTGEFYE